MHESLSNRFRGAFLGAVLGEAIGTASLTCSSRLIWQALQQQKLPLASTSIGSMQWNWSRCFFSEAERLVDQSASTSIPLGTDSVELALQTLPLALFHHDQPSVLQAALQETLRPIELSPAVAAVNHTVSLLLRERLIPHQLIPQLIRDLDLSADESIQLQQVQVWLETSIDLTSLKGTVRQSSLAEASFGAIKLILYGFLYTPEAFPLTLLRVAQLTPQPIAACTLAGAISGLYNGWTGLAWGWRQAIWTELANTELVNLQALAIRTEADLLECADRLLAAWSGVNQPARWLEKPRFASITAAPRIIRPNEA